MYPYIWAADAGDLVTSAFLGAIPHPPGFPLYWLLSRVFLLIPVSTPALRISLISLIFAIATSFFLYKSALYTVKKVFKSNHISFWMLRVSCIAGVSYVVFSFNFLIYANVQEIYSMSLFFLAGSAYYLLRFSQTKASKDHLWFLAFLIIGILHHYIIGLFIFVYFALLYNMRIRPVLFYKKNAFRVFIFILAGLIPYALMYMLSTNRPIIFWEEKTLHGFLLSFFRVRYGILNTGAGIQSFASKLLNIYIYLIHLKTYFILIILFLIPGFYYLAKKNKRIFLYLGSSIIVFGIFLPFYTDANLLNIHSRGIIERYYLFSYVFFPPLFTVGILYSAQVLKNNPAIVKTKQAKLLLYKGFIFLFIFLIPAVFILKNIYQSYKLMNTPIFENHAKNMLSIPKKGSVLFLSSDINLFPAQYMRYVLGYRKDLIVLSKTSAQNPLYYNLIAKKFPELKYTPNGKTASERMDDFLEKILKQGRGVYFSKPDNVIKYSYTQEFLLTQVHKKSSNDFIIKKYSPAELNKYFLPVASYKRYSGTYQFYFYQTLQDIYSRALFDIGESYYKNREFKNASALITASYKMQKNDDTVYLLALALRKNNKCSDAEKILLDYFEENKKPKTAFALSRLYGGCFKNRVKYTFWDGVYKRLGRQK